MAKALTQSDVVYELERWASSKKKLEKAEAAQAAEIEPFAAEFEARSAEIVERHRKTIDKLTTEVDQRETVITGWLNGRKKTTTVDATHATAEVVHGVKLGNRIVDTEKLVALCKKKKVDFWQFVSLLVGKLDEKLGKAEVDAISRRDSTDTKTVRLKLKD